jgi:hypothetical protein
LAFFSLSFLIFSRLALSFLLIISPTKAAGLAYSVPSGEESSCSVSREPYTRRLSSSKTGDNFSSVFFTVFLITFFLCLDFLINFLASLSSLSDFYSK